MTPRARRPAPPAPFVRRFRGYLAQLPLLANPFLPVDGPVRELHRLHNRVALAHVAQPWRGLLLALSLALWPLRSVWLTAGEVRRCGPGARSLGGKGRWRQAVEILWLGNLHQLTPRHYYYFGHWRRGAPSPARFVTDGGAQRIFRALNRDADLAVLDDKRRFHDFCATHGYPTPPLLAVFARGTAELPADPAALARDLFFKLRHGWHARGAARWSHDPASGRYRGPTGDALSWPELQARYEQISATAGDYLVQPRLHDHPAIADLGNGALATVRMITIVHPDGAVREFSSMFNLPTRQAVINNLVDGGLACPVDSATGTLRCAFSGAPGKPRFDVNPFNRAPIAGRQLPCWRETVALACDVHSRLADIAVIGWDIALTGRGPVLLEGNTQIAVNFHQIPPNPPFAQTEFPALLVWHLRRHLARHSTAP